MEVPKEGRASTAAAAAAAAAAAGAAAVLLHYGSGHSERLWFATLCCKCANSAAVQKRPKIARTSQQANGRERRFGAIHAQVPLQILTRSRAQISIAPTHMGRQRVLR